MKNWLDSFLAHRPLLFRVIGRIVRPDEVEDIVQETFLHSFAASKKQVIDNPRAFMVTTAKNIALNHIGRADQRLNTSIEDTDGGEWQELSASLENQFQSEEMFLLFCRAVSALPAGCRKVFVLKKVYGLSQKEIADYMGISASAVEKHVAKGMVMTADYMDSNGYGVRPGCSSGNKRERFDNLD